MRCVSLLRMLMKSLKRNDEFFMRKLFWELSKILIRELFGFSWENYIENSRNILRREMLRFWIGNSCEHSRTFSTEISTRIRIYSSWETSQRDLIKRILHGTCLFFFFTCSPSRDYIDLPTTESQVPKAFLCWTCYPSSRLNLVTSWVLYFSPFRYQFYWLVYRSNISVKCLAQEHNIVVILAKRSPTLNQIRLSVAYPL